MSNFIQRTITSTFFHIFGLWMKFGISKLPFGSKYKFKTTLASTLIISFITHKFYFNNWFVLKNALLKTHFLGLSPPVTVKTDPREFSNPFTLLICCMLLYCNIRIQSSGVAFRFYCAFSTSSDSFFTLKCSILVPQKAA